MTQTATRTVVHHHNSHRTIIRPQREQMWSKYLLLLGQKPNISYWTWIFQCSSGTTVCQPFIQRATSPEDGDAVQWGASGQAARLLTRNLSDFGAKIKSTHACTNGPQGGAPKYNAAVLKEAAKACKCFQWNHKVEKEIASWKNKPNKNV